MQWKVDFYFNDSWKAYEIHANRKHRDFFSNSDVFFEQSIFVQNSP